MQAKRHGLGQIEASYNLVSFLKSEKSWRQFYAFYTVFDLYFSFMAIPFAVLIMPLQHAIYLLPHSEYDDGSFLTIFTIINLTTLVLAFPFYEIMKRKMTKEVYNRENITIGQLFLLPIAVSITGLIFGFIPMIIGGIQILQGETFTHQVAQKMGKNKTSKGGLFSISPDIE